MITISTANKAKISVIEKLMDYARLMRRRGDPAEAVAASEYELKFQEDLKRVNAEAGAEALSETPVGR